MFGSPRQSRKPLGRKRNCRNIVNGAVGNRSCTETEARVEPSRIVPALNSLLSDLRKRKIDIILIWSLDRLARSLRHLLAISEECRLMGVDLVSLRQNIDTTLPAGRLTFQILGAVAEFERELLRTRVKAGMAQARRAGKRIGRPALRHFGPTELERIRSLRTQGASVRKLAKDFATTQWMIAKLLGSPEAAESVAA